MKNLLQLLFARFRIGLPVRFGTHYQVECFGPDGILKDRKSTRLNSSH